VNGLLLLAASRRNNATHTQVFRPLSVVIVGAIASTALKDLILGWHRIRPGSDF
jgi:hypothetical protein